MNANTVVLMIFISLLLFAVGVGVAVFFLTRLMNPEPSPTQDSLTRIKRYHRQVEDYVENEAAKKLATLVKGADYKNMKLGRFLERYSYVHKLKRMLMQAGMKIPVDQYVLRFYIYPIIIGFFLGAVTQFYLLLFVGLMVPVGAHMFVKIKKGKRLHKFTTQFPYALNLMTSSLRAGHSFQSSLTVVASELKDPIGTEFSLVVKDFNLGIPVREALERLMANLDGLPDIRMFTTAVLIQRESGGNLAEILDKLSYTIRERFKLKGQVSSMTAQSRLTGYCLGAAPIVVVVILNIISPDYIKPMFEEPLGRVALFIAFVMQVIGFIVIKRIVDIRV